MFANLGVSLWGYVIAAGFSAVLAGVGTGYVVHRMDAGRLQTEIATQAQRDAVAAKADLAAVLHQNERLQAASDAATRSSQAAEAARVKSDAALRAAVQKERQNDPQIAACLDTKLPDSILRQLPH